MIFSNIELININELRNYENMFHWHDEIDTEIQIKFQFVII